MGQYSAPYALRCGKMGTGAMKSAVIIPTGDEVKNGIVLDTDSPEILAQLIRQFPEMKVVRLGPLTDDEEAILTLLQETVLESPDLIVLVGGSGGGHRFSPSLGKDYTQSALEKFLIEKAASEIYGKNGHLWCKLICGKKDKTVIINVPGPFYEAKAAMSAFLNSYAAGMDLSQINKEMAQAVYDQYPRGEE